MTGLMVNVHSPAQTNRDGDILRVRPPGRKMQEMTTWIQTSTGSDHLGWKTSTYNKKNMERTAFKENSHKRPL